MSTTPEAHPSAAGRWFVVRVDHAPSRRRRALWLARWLVLDAASLGFHHAAYRSPGTILVVRRDDGSVVARLSFAEPAQMWWRAEDLAAELRERHVFDFCRDLRIPLHHVSGAGID